MPAWTFEQQHQLPGQERPMHRVVIELWWTDEEAEEWFETRFLREPALDFEDSQAMETWVKALFDLTLRTSRGNPDQVAIMSQGDGSTRVESLYHPELNPLGLQALQNTEGTASFAEPSESVSNEITGSHSAEEG